MTSRPACWLIDHSMQRRTLTKFSSLAALKVFEMTTFCIISNKNFAEMTKYSFQCWYYMKQKRNRRNTNTPTQSDRDTGLFPSLSAGRPYNEQQGRLDSVVSGWVYCFVASRATQCRNVWFSIVLFFFMIWANITEINDIIEKKLNCNQLYFLAIFSTFPWQFQLSKTLFFFQCYISVFDILLLRHVAVLKF